jgi:hypothetical protein
VRSRANGGSRPRSKAGALASAREAATLDRLLVALEAPPVDDAARARLARSLIRHGEQHVILLVRTIIESEGNAAALVEPMAARPLTAKKFIFVAAFLRPLAAPTFGQAF